MAGAFDVDEDGNAYLLHRGKVGGGREGIGKSSFLSTQGDYLREVIDGNRYTSVVVISPLGSERLPNHVASFASQVRAYKETAVIDTSGSDKGEEERDEDSFSPEFEGTKEFSLQESIEAQCSHGTVVRNLRENLQEIGAEPANDHLRDLFLRNKEGKIRAVYEVKTSSDRQSVYSAIGQLIMYSPVAQQPKQVLVLPNDLDPKLRVGIEKRGFTVVRYEWKKGEATFPRSDRLLPSSGSG
jgi:hypothetical protein